MASYDDKDNDNILPSKWTMFKAGLGLSIVGAGCFLAARYHVAKSSEKLAFTGWGIEDITVCKQGLQWPLQRVTRFDLKPKTIKVPVGAMSEERIPFKMPAVFTVGPDITDLNERGLHRYAKLMVDMDAEEFRKAVIGVIEGETRILSATMPLDHLFNERDKFKEIITTNINKELKPLGVLVWNANIEELDDLEDSSYFAEQRKRALKAVSEKARVDVAEAINSGDIGTKSYERETRIKVAALEKDSVLAENERDREIAESKAALRVAQAEYEQKARIAEAESRAAAEQRTNDLQFAVEEKRKIQRAEQLRADELTDAQVKAEAVQLTADAYLYQQTKHAEATLRQMEAEAEGLHRLVEAIGGPDAYKQYLVLKGDILPTIADAQAKAVKDMKPIIWSTGSEPQTPVANLIRNLPPLAEGISQWTGVDLKDLMKSAESVGKN